MAIRYTPETVIGCRLPCGAVVESSAGFDPFVVTFDRGPVNIYGHAQPCRDWTFNRDGRHCYATLPDLLPPLVDYARPLALDTDPPGAATAEAKGGAGEFLVEADWKADGPFALICGPDGIVAGKPSYPRVRNATPAEIATLYPEPKPEPEAAPAGDWIPHGGGPNPVREGERLAGIKFRNGSVWMCFGADAGDHTRWDHFRKFDDVIAYSVHPPRKPEPEAVDFKAEAAASHVEAARTAFAEALADHRRMVGEDGGIPGAFKGPFMESAPEISADSPLVMAALLGMIAVRPSNDPAEVMAMARQIAELAAPPMVLA